MLLRWTRLHDLPVLGQEALFSRRSRMFYIRAKTFPGNRGCTKNCSRCRRPLPTVGRVVDQPARPELFADKHRHFNGRDTFVRSLNVTLNLAMDEQFVIHTPLMDRDKSEVWELADELGVFDLVRTQTLTCYNGIMAEGCGHCPACKLRREGLEKYLKRRQ